MSRLFQKKLKKESDTSLNKLTDFREENLDRSTGDKKETRSFRAGLDLLVGLMT